MALSLREGANKLNNSLTKEGIEMRQKVRAAALVCLAGGLFAAGPAGAAQMMVAGWDFTQYFGAGSLIVDQTFTDVKTLRSNYSDFDTTFGAGGDSQPFGTLYMDGTNGSTNISGPGQVTPTTTSLTFNLATPGANEIPVGDVAFDA